MFTKKIYNWISNLGVDDTLPDELVRRIRMHNILGFVSMFLMIFFPITFIYLELYEGFYLLGIGCISMLSPLVFNYLRYYDFSRYFAIIVGALTFMSGVILYGYDAGFTYGIVAMLCLPILFFKERKLRAITYVSIFLEGLILYLIFKDSLPLVEITSEKFLLNIVLFVCCTTLIIMYFISSASFNDFYENKSLALVDQLTSRNEELKNFSYSTSHDLKQPLRTILNFISVLKKKKSHQLDEEGKHFLDLVEDSGTRLNDLIEALLSHSVLGQTISFETFDSNQLVKEVLSDLNILIRENSAKITVNDLPMITANRQELGAVFQNLITNAIKFKQNINYPVIQIDCLDDGAYWKFMVKDNGIGIEEKVQDRVFDMFQKGHTNQMIKGTGIGLANCKKIIEHHSGKIWVNSSLNEGSQFSFTILKAPNMSMYN